MFVCLFAFQEEESFDKCVDETTFPRIIGSGEFWSLDPLCIATEGEDLITLSAGSSMANALGLLFSVYYVLTLPVQPRPVMFTFCEMLIGIEQDAKKKNSNKQVYFSPLRLLKTVSRTFQDMNFAGWL